MKLHSKLAVMAFLLMCGFFGASTRSAAQLQPDSLAKVTACQAGNRDACVRAYNYIFEPNREAQKARNESMIKGCELGEASLCYASGDLFYRGDKDFPKSMDIAAKYYSMACKFGETTGCLVADKMNVPSATNLVANQANDERKRCAAGVATACSAAGHLLENGPAGVANKTEALGLYRKGCQLGDRIGCARLSELQKNLENSQREAARKLADIAARNDPKRKFGAPLSQSDAACLQDATEKFYTSGRGRCLAFSTLASGSQGCDQYETVDVPRYRARVKNICNRPMSFQEYCGGTPFGWATLLPGEIYTRQFTSPCRLAY